MEPYAWSVATTHGCETRVINDTEKKRLEDTHRRRTFFNDDLRNIIIEVI